MGNSNSTRWNDHVKARTVESCIMLDIKTFIEHDLLKSSVSGGTLDLGTDLQLDFVVGPKGKHVRLLAIQWEVADLLGNVRTFEQWIVLTYVRPTRGRATWRFRCTGWRADESCGRSAAKLYLPPDRRRFACRRCWGLVYRSSQQSGTYATRYRQMVRTAEKAGINLSDAGLDLEPEDGARALRELIESG